MIQLIECEGAPRDLGLDQGTQCRAALQAAYRSRSRWQRLRLRVLAESNACRHARQEIRRFYPQQAEAMEALARASRVPLAWLIAHLAGNRGPASPADALMLAAASEIADRGGLLARALPTDAIVRRSRPESGFRSIELTQPWRIAPLAGVNEAGLAVACVTSAGVVAAARHAAPAALLAHDCLRRFDSLDGAIDWLLVRPGGGRSMLVLADLSGEIAGVRIDGDERAVFRPADGLIVHTGGHARQPEIEKGLREASPLLGSDLGRFLGMPLVVVEPARRAIALLGGRAGGAGDRRFEI
ncbi:MAG: hypothetical protein JRE43_05100 [Deltaproteobacteria bacterium]|nr:hypothetical protein [Deltaproteobacteria bacterium]MBW2541503.1 hypothetical protein [Deltaproteobacteria bacterium]